MALQQLSIQDSAGFDRFFAYAQLSPRSQSHPKCSQRSLAFIPLLCIFLEADLHLGVLLDSLSSIGGIRGVDGVDGVGGVGGIDGVGVPP